MTFTFRRAVNGAAKILIGIYATSGCGKTYSALLLARGFAGPNGRIAMIESESGRGEIYVDAIPGGYDVLPIAGNFSPKVYGGAIGAAEDAKYDVLIIDSASPEWEGIGGVLDMAAKNEAAGKKGPLVWQKPKIDHQREFVLRMMATPIPLVIVCMRAKYPMEQEKKPNGQKGDWRRSEKLEPKQSEDILFEMLAHGWIDEQHAFHLTKYPEAVRAFKGIFVDGEPLTIATGERLAAWSKTRGKAPPVIAQPDDAPDESARIGSNQIQEITAACLARGVSAERLCRAAKVSTVAEILAEDYPRALQWVQSAKPATSAGLPASAAQPAAPTFADVSAAMNAAKTSDALDIAADMIRTVHDEQQRNELSAELAKHRERINNQ